MKVFPTEVISDPAMKGSGCSFIKDEEVLGNGRVAQQAMVERVMNRVHTVMVVRESGNVGRQSYTRDFLDHALCVCTHGHEYGTL